MGMKVFSIMVEAGIYLTDTNLFIWKSHERNEVIGMSKVNPKKRKNESWIKPLLHKSLSIANRTACLWNQ